jgi:hypothetical protein
MIEWIIGIAIFSALIAGWFYHNHLERQRRQALIALTHQLGLELNWQLLDGDLARFQSFEIGQRGRMPRSEIAITADDGETRMLVFDFAYDTGSGKHKKTHWFSMAMCTRAQLNCPGFSLEPMTWKSRIADFMGYAIIRFDDDPDFSKRFSVRGKDPDAVKRFLDDRRRAYLMQFPQQRLEGKSDTLLIIRKDGKLKVEKVRSLMTEGLAITTAMCDPESTR